MTMKNTLAGLLGLTMVATGVGCGNESEVKEFRCENPGVRVKVEEEGVTYGPDEIFVPGVTYKVRPGDNFTDLVDVSGAKKFTTGYKRPGSVLLRQGNGVTYEFPLEDFVVEANDSYDSSRGLIIGDTLIFPDFDEDGTINGALGEKRGKFTLTVSRTEYDIYDKYCDGVNNYMKSDYTGYRNVVDKNIAFKHGE